MARLKKRQTSRRASGSGQIYKDGARYRASLAVGTDPVTGRPRYRSVRTESHAEAVDALKRMQTDFATGHLEPASGKNLAAYLTSWLDNKIKPMRAPSTYRQYAWLIKEHINPHLGTMPVEKVKRQDVQQLLAIKAGQEVRPRDKDGKNLSGKTLGRDVLRLIRAVLSAAYSDAIKDGLTARNPAEHAEIPAAKRTERAFLKPQEAAKLIQQSKRTELGPLFEFMITTGTRIGEATGLRWCDVDLERKMAHIRGQLQRQDGKLAYRPTTKTNQDRYVPLTDSVVEVLQGLQLGKMVDASLPDPDGIVFLNSEGRRIDPKYANNRLREACNSAKVPSVSAHKLRHTAATLALSATGDLHAVQKLLGHQQVSLTSDLYGHATAETLRPTTNAIEKALKTKPKA